MNRTTFWIAAGALALGACSTQQGNQQEQTPGTQAGTNLAWMDKSVVPGDDFYNYADGTFMKTTEIPADRSSVGGGYIADLEREKNTRELFDEILKSDAAANTDEGRIANYYKAYLDTGAIDHAGLTPAKADLEAIARVADKQQLSSAIGSTIRADTDPLNATNFHTENLFGIFVTQGLATPGEQLPYLMQGGIGLPEREYYLSADPKMADLRTKYKAYVAQILQLANYPDPQGSAQRIVDLETKIARAHASREESEDWAKASQVWTRAELESKAPGLDWGALLGAAQLGSAPRFDAYFPDAIPKLSALVGSEPLQSWKDWLTFHALNKQANVLPKAFRDASFAFNGTALAGTPQQRPRDKLALNATSFALQDAVGKAYVGKYFPASAKAEIQDMVTNLKAAFAKRVQAINWLSLIHI